MLTIDARMQTDITASQARPANPERDSTAANPHHPTDKTVSQKAENMADMTAVAEFRGKVGLKETEEAVMSIQKDMELLNTRISFRVDNKSDEIVVDVIDKDTNKVIRQIPSEEMLRIKTAFKELMKGILLNVTA
ncbi:MAG: flagellar protein FlaG [Dissulfuribacterales bacterium]